MTFNHDVSTESRCHFSVEFAAKTFHRLSTRQSNLTAEALLHSQRKIERSSSGPEMTAYG
jgi:hypothetical protein